MIELREITAAVIFVVGCATCYTLFTEGFVWELLALSFACFLLAYFIWPSKRKGQRGDESRWLDYIELIVEFPIRALLFFLRSLSRTLGGGSGGIDIDI